MTAYVPTVWVNGTSPALSATNLNKLTDELETQAADLSIAHSLPTWVNDTTPALTDATPLNEMERVCLAVAQARGLTYNRTTWQAGWTPGRNAYNFNKLEVQAQANRASIDAVVTFSKYASPSGNDANAGTLASPYRTFLKLASSLLPGQAGALRGGAYSAADHHLTVSGQATNRITISGYPGETAVVSGPWHVDASYITFTRFTVVGAISAYRPGLIFDHLDVSQSPATVSAFYLGDQGVGCTDGIIRYCKIHDYGSNFHFDHGVYMDNGNNIEVHHNWIWGGSHGWGIQLYDSPTNCRVHHNVIDLCGSGFVYSANAANNLSSNNVISNSVQMYAQNGSPDARAAIGGYPPDGAGNAFRDNCSYQNADGIGSQANVAMSGNFTANPLYVDAANHNYSVQPTSPLASWGLWDGT